MLTVGISIPCRELSYIYQRQTLHGIYTACSRMGLIYAMRGLSAVVRLDELGQCEGLDAWDG